LRFETTYSSCKVRISKNICRSSGGAQEKGKTWWNSVYHQNWWFFQFHPLLNANELLSRFLLNLTLCMTKLRVLVLCFSYFTDNSNIPWVFLLASMLIGTSLAFSWDPFFGGKGGRGRYASMRKGQGTQPKEETQGNQTPKWRAFTT